MELGVLARQCLAHRIPDPPTLIHEAVAWEEQRHTVHVKMRRQFTTADACIEMKKRSPTVELQ